MKKVLSGFLLIMMLIFAMMMPVAAEFPGTWSVADDADDSLNVWSVDQPENDKIETPDGYIDYSAQNVLGDIGFFSALQAEGYVKKGNAVKADLIHTYTDVRPSDWFYETVMGMTGRGLFTGRGEVINGVGTFDPNGIMTRAEFITVISRILFPKNVDMVKDGAPWWTYNYKYLINYNIISDSVFNGQMDEPISRQEMAYVITAAMRAHAESVNPVSFAVAFEKIPDFGEVDASFKQNVAEVYSMGIICGMDSHGTFAPNAILTRAEGTTVISRLIKPSSRKPTSLEATDSMDTDAPIIIYEGEESQRRFAKEGDTVIKADGTQVVLKKGPHGVLGEGQGVAPDLGVINEGFTVTAKNITGCSFAGGAGFKDSTGDWIKSQAYYVNMFTGEGHWYSEWATMTSVPEYNGAFDNQLSPDMNFIWDDGFGEWIHLYIQKINDDGAAMIKQANGLN